MEAKQENPESEGIMVSEIEPEVKVNVEVADEAEGEVWVNLGG